MMWPFFVLGRGTTMAPPDALSVAMYVSTEADMDALFDYRVLHGAFELIYLLFAYAYFRIMSNYLVANGLHADSPAEYFRAVLKLVVPALVTTGVWVVLAPAFGGWGALDPLAVPEWPDNSIHLPTLFERLTIVVGLSLLAINDASKR